MGLPGLIHIEIATVFDSQSNSVSRRVRYIGGWGLNSLSACTLGIEKHWKVDWRIMADTMELPDGTYTLGKKHVGPGMFDYKWTPDNDDENLGGL